MDIIETMFLIALALASYAVAAYVAVKLTMEKLGARSSLFGIGMATMFGGFIWNMILRDMVIGEKYWERSLAYYISWICLIIGLAGIVMMAVDIIKAVNELTAWTVKKNDPVWKQTQTGQKGSEK